MSKGNAEASVSSRRTPRWNMRLWSVWLYTCGGMKLDLGGKKGFSWEKDFIFTWRKLEKLNLKVWIEWQIVNYCVSAANILALMMLIFKAREANSHFYVGFCSSFPPPLSLSVYILRHTRAPASDPLSFRYPTSVWHICMCSISVPLPVSTSFTQSAIRFPCMCLVLLQVLLEPTAFSYCSLEWPSLEHRVSFQGKFWK